MAASVEAIRNEADDRESRSGIGRHLGAALFVIAIAAAFLLRGTWSWLDVYPEHWSLPVQTWINDGFAWLRNDFRIGPLAFRDLTGGLVWLLEWPVHWVRTILLTGVPALGLGPLPWITVAALVGVVGHYVSGWRLAIFSTACMFYLAIFGVWAPSMRTLAVVLVSVPLAAFLGLALGIAAARRRWAEALLTPIFNLMQATPHFAYLVPVVVLFGFGAVPGVIATTIFAMPPMARCAFLGLKTVPPTSLEAGKMAGLSRLQLLIKVELSAARPTIMVGLNQVINMTLAMVVITSLIGVTGLGYDLLNALERLRLGSAVELGVAVVLIAVVMDRLGQAYARMPYVHKEESGGFLHRHPHWSAAIALTVATLALASLFSFLQVPARSMTITVAPATDFAIRWFTDLLFDELRAFNFFMIVNVLRPTHEFIDGLPWLAVVAFVGLLGHLVGGLRLALAVMALAMFPAVSGMWEPAMRTVYMILLSVVACILIGFPLGLWAAGSERGSRFALGVCDTLQTFPSFIYLIPVIMLFRVGDLAAITAVIVYALAPIMRYTIVGLHRVPREAVEAAVTSGCTPRQTLVKVKLPLAFPEIMLGVNQTIVLSLFMVAIASLIGTRDLGQEINRALSGPDVGQALVAGLCIAFIAIIADLIIRRWSETRKRQLGIE